MQYEHTVTVAFTVKSEFNAEQTENIETITLLESMAVRLAYLRQNPCDADEAFCIE